MSVLAGVPAWFSFPRSDTACSLRVVKNHPYDPSAKTSYKPETWLTRPLANRPARTTDAFVREDTYAATRLPVDLASTLIGRLHVASSMTSKRPRVARAWVPVCVTDELREPAASPCRGRRPFALMSAGADRASCGPTTASAAIAARAGGRGARAGRAVLPVSYHAWAYDLDGACGTAANSRVEVPDDQQTPSTCPMCRCSTSRHALYPARSTRGAVSSSSASTPLAPSLAHSSATCPNGSPAPAREHRLLRRVEYEMRRTGGSSRDFKVLPPALGPPRSREGLAAEAHHRWQGTGKTSASALRYGEPDDGGWQGALSRPRRTTLERASSGSSRTSRSTRCRPHLSAACAARCDGTPRGRVPACASSALRREAFSTGRQTGCSRSGTR